MSPRFLDFYPDSVRIYFNGFLMPTYFTANRLDWISGTILLVAPYEMLRFYFQTPEKWYPGDEIDVVASKYLSSDDHVYDMDTIKFRINEYYFLNQNKDDSLSR